METHTLTVLTKTGRSYVTDDGQPVAAHPLYLATCACGWRGGVWYASLERAEASFRRNHVERVSA